MTTNTPRPINRVAKYFDEDLEDNLFQKIADTADALLRMRERRRQKRCEALVRELERIEQELTGLSNEEPEAEGTPKPSADGSGTDDTKLTANEAGDNHPVPVLLINLNNFRIDLGWLV